MNFRDATEAFAVPGDDSLIDLCSPETGRSEVYGETLEQIRARYPGAVVVNIAEFLAAKAERQHATVVWRPCSEQRYDDMLNVLPPVEWFHGPRGGFLVGEPWDHDAGNGQPRFAAFRKRGGGFEESDRPMTRAEFRALAGA